MKMPIVTRNMCSSLITTKVAQSAESESYSVDLIGSYKIQEWVEAELLSVHARPWFMEGENVLVVKMYWDDVSVNSPIVIDGLIWLN